MRRATVAAALSALALATLMFFPLRVAGQAVFGTISGTVTDPSGAVLADATVRVLNLNTNITTTLKTNSSGVYNASSLNPGTYTIQAEARGFKTAVAKAVVLEVNANVRIDLKLEVGQTSDTVEVTGQAPLLQTQQSNLGQTVNEQQINQLPLSGGNGRSVYNLLPLVAGVSQQTGGMGTADNDNLRINGDRPRTDQYQIDGTTITAPVWGGQILNPSVDSIQEFQVQANSLSAEYGTSGGVVIAVSKTGTNQFHGSAYDFLRNQKLNARNYFEDPTQKKNPFTYNEFGGTIGGPVIKNKLFFFFDVQFVRQHGSSPASSPVPNAAFRSGDLSAICTGTWTAGICSNAGQQLHLPSGTPILNNNLAGLISPVSQKILNIIPTSSAAGAALGTSDFFYNQPFSSPTTRYNPRVDYNLGTSDHIFGAYHYDHGAPISYTLIVGPEGLNQHPSTNKAASIGWTHTFSPTLLNDFRFGYMGVNEDRAPIGAGNIGPADFGITGLPACMDSLSSGGKKCGLPTVKINGYFTLDDSQENFQQQSTYSFADMITKTIGRHTLKIGGDARRYRIGNYQPNAVNGDFEFKGAGTGNSFADFLLGYLGGGSTVQVQNATLDSHAWAYSLFIQDDFKLTPKLTLNLGLRWQLDKSFSEAHNGLAFFNPFTAVWEQFGVNAPATTFDASMKEFGPRIGFAYNVKGGLVVRGGYGINFPGTLGHGRAGDGQPGPNLLANTSIPAGTNWGSALAIANPDPSQITALLPTAAAGGAWASNVSGASWAPRNQTPTYVELYNLTVEQQLGKNTKVELGYVGSRGVHLPIQYGYNICQQSRASFAAAAPNYSFNSSPYCNSSLTTAAVGGYLPTLFINPGWWGLASSSYNALQMKVEHRFSHGFSLLSNFTWSKLIDNSSSDWGGFGALDTFGQDFYDLKAARSISAGDIPRRLTIAPIVELPFGPGKKWMNNGVLSQVLGGWRASSIFSMQDGYPVGTWDGQWGPYASLPMMGSSYATMVGNPLPSGFQQTVGPHGSWFNKSAFYWGDLQNPPDPTAQWGNAPRFFSNLRVDGVVSLDFSLQKEFKIPVGERTRLRFQMDAFNLPNHPMFGAPGEAANDPYFGKVTATSVANRSIQLGLHLSF